MGKFYTCKISSAEIISNAFPVTDLPEMGGFSVQSSLFEDTDPYSETSGETVNDVIKTFNYVETNFDKKMDYVKYFKGYLKALKAIIEKENPDQLKQFQKDAGAFMKHFMSMKKGDLGFWMNEKNSVEGYIPWGYWKPDSADPPVFMYFSWGLNTTKI